MWKLIFIILAMVFTQVIAFAETAECTDRPECWPETSAMYRGLILVEQQKKLDNLMLKKHEQLVKNVSETISADNQFLSDGRLIEALNRQQIGWLKFRSDECELIGSLTGAGGSWPSTFSNQCAVNLTEQRIRKIGYALKCVGRISPEKRLYDQNACLYQLAPLVIK